MQTMAGAQASGRAAVVREIETSGVVAIIRMKEVDRLQAVVEALIEGGVTALEVTMTVPGAVEVIGRLTERLPPGFVLGAGTVLDPETARQVILAGARFIVSPIYNPSVVRLCHRYDVAALPGCFTPTEILSAWEAGADLVKVFPATALGPGYIKDVRAPLPQVRLVPTGGVTVENAGGWIRAGAAAVGIGTALLDMHAIAAGDYQEIAARARRLVEAVAAARA
jgi:2-dehydro-3-deoxyphosphogluconate aldolase / (4S)-4-hydroxy-2-oxoglutarate aldolase